MPIDNLSILQSSNLPILQRHQLFRPWAPISRAISTPLRRPRVPEIRNVLADRDATRVAGRSIAQLPRPSVDLDAAGAIADGSEIVRTVHDVACVAPEIRAIVEDQPRVTVVAVAALIAPYPAAIIVCCCARIRRRASTKYDRSTLPTGDSRSNPGTLGSRRRS